MKYCNRCGKELEDQTQVCPQCGNYQGMQQGLSRDTGSAGWLVLGFFFPLVGLILYLVWRDTEPKNANQAGKGALIGVIVSFVLGFIYGICLITLLKDIPQYLLWL